MSTLKPFSGAERKLVLAFDVGTTFSGVAYALLDPGQAPTIQSVTRFPGQENAAGNSKIPSVLYYDASGSMRAAGAEAISPAMELEADENSYIFVEWFKLHLRPESVDDDSFKNTDIPPLPPGKTVIDVFSQFLQYLYNCAKQYIVETHANGDRVWDSLGDRIDIVLSHPNGWEGLQQSKMRTAACRAGLVPNTLAGRARIHFVTEGEASLYYCVQNGLVADSMQSGESVMVVDAGGGTVDISTYKFVSVSPITAEEAAPPDCLMQGSTTVNVRASKLLTDKLSNSRYSNDVASMLEYFDKHTKQIFKNSNEPSYIKFGSMGCNDVSAGIRRGQLVLSGSEVAYLFEPSAFAIVQAVQRQRQLSPPSLQTVFLVGGFAASPWLFYQLQERLKTLGLQLTRPDRHTSKAVSEGAVAFHLERWVSARKARVTYGVTCCRQYDNLNEEHRHRHPKTKVWPSGLCMVPDGYLTLLSRGSQVHGNHEVYRDMFVESRKKADLKTVKSIVTCYRGKLANPNWTDVEPEMFSTLCTVHADTSRVQKVKKKGPKGPYFTQTYRVVLLCGLTELKAQISWIENVSLRSVSAADA
ncbi:hypothetical protein POSPLADRAFT_1144067 [Postia placenta MAD-698-R-SB12]|uniref:Uncharacterized protein n=1 Tax=Postia placenta MAD-698-R-SB12 TaxID=670580 RepID=A0A1X6N044_9APHY|nr:hypothetical protein POSPLADRAFT_1144067 [Postia placenta MAD-698-R-SB12]OSX61860.1 hypothetical protein POSPLADRAFT_1144067 [Postia placenta MAD-698-R-SB12]